MRSRQEWNNSKIYNSKHIDVTDLISDNVLVEQQQLCEAFKQADISIKSQMIFIGEIEKY